MFPENDELTATFVAVFLFLSFIVDDNVIIFIFNQHFSFEFFFFLIFVQFLEESPSSSLFLIVFLFSSYGSTNSSLRIS